MNQITINILKLVNLCWEKTPKNGFKPTRDFTCGERLISDINYMFILKRQKKRLQNTGSDNN